MYRVHRNALLESSKATEGTLLRWAKWRDRLSQNPRGPNDQQKFDLDRNFQSRSKFLILLEIFNLDVSISPQKIGPRWVARSKFSFSIEIFNLDRNLEFF